ncbi:hypothetical protein GCM10027444_00460 [Actinopolyspora lacussalsi]
MTVTLAPSASSASAADLPETPAPATRIRVPTLLMTSPKILVTAVSFIGPPGRARSTAAAGSGGTRPGGNTEHQLGTSANQSA